MYAKIKYFVFTLLYGLLLARLLFYIGDPTVAGPANEHLTALIAELPPSKPLPFYTDWRSWLDWLYTITDYLELPIGLLCNWILSTFPITQGLLQNQWFPQLDIQSIVAPAHHNILAMPSIKGMLPLANAMLPLKGALDWFCVLTMGILSAIGTWLDALAFWLQNIVWNIFTEFAFTKKKQAVYKSVIEKRSVELTQLNMQYHNLARETSKLKDTVVTDELTQLYNKRFFIERFQSEFVGAKEGNKELSLIMVDIDHFKRLNDTYGHLMGDKVLKEVAQVVKRSCGTAGFACRFGGEEFSLILPGKNMAEAVMIAERIRMDVPLLRYEEDPNLVVTISQGLFSCNFKLPESKTLMVIDHMIKLADDELYRAKLEGRDRVCASAIQ